MHVATSLHMPSRPPARQRRTQLIPAFAAQPCLLTSLYHACCTADCCHHQLLVEQGAKLHARKALPTSDDLAPWLPTERTQPTYRWFLYHKPCTLHSILLAQVLKALVARTHRQDVVVAPLRGLSLRGGPQLQLPLSAEEVGAQGWTTKNRVNGDGCGCGRRRWPGCYYPDGHGHKAAAGGANSGVEHGRLGEQLP